MENGKSCAECVYFSYGQHNEYDDYEIIRRYDGYCKNELNDISEYIHASVVFNDYCSCFVSKYEQPKPSIDQHQKTIDNPGVNVEINQS